MTETTDVYLANAPFGLDVTASLLPSPAASRANRSQRGPRSPHRSAPTVPGPRRRPHAVTPEESRVAAGILGAEATWQPAPEHDQPAGGGRPAMVGYLVLVPADRVASPGADEPALPATVPYPSSAARAAATPAPHGASMWQAPDGPTGTGAAPAAADAALRIDREQRVVQAGGRVLNLTYLEFELLAHLVERPHRVHTRDALVTTVWGYGHVGDGRTVDVHIARLRRKLGAPWRRSLVTVRRVGYKFVPLD